MMKKIEKVWPAYLKTNPSVITVKALKELIAKPYKNFNEAYSNLPMLLTMAFYLMTALHGRFVSVWSK
ncbi:hypothetical protein [Fructobacillus americanaquae]|uniref:Uncharacterized protein n=1 Tax=Fructobacillus americanaquae TaxID=2940302 RepID=A0ABY5BZT4_9LACO|nr:hypothetical protein [Fructobacillus americanaquae]USS92019.1 hypothetical protein M3M36_06825 [Fructobacillus americanaquae]